MKKLRLHGAVKSAGLAIAASTLMAASANAGTLVYQPINPNFGGNPFNYQPLLNQAQLQNQFDDVDPLGDAFDPLQNFEDTVTSALLSSISFEIADAILGENRQDAGQFLVNDTTISFVTQGDNVVVTIFDGGTGASTTITIPVPTF